MSKRRQPGEIVKRIPGSGFLGAASPQLIQVPFEPKYTQEAETCLVCLDGHCREWANLEVIDENHQKTGQFLYHISECEMMDLSELSGRTPNVTHRNLEVENADSE